MSLRTVGWVSVLLLSCQTTACAFDPGLLYAMNDEALDERPPRERSTLSVHMDQHYHPRYTAHHHAPDGNHRPHRHGHRQGSRR